MQNPQVYMLRRGSEEGAEEAPAATLRRGRPGGPRATNLGDWGFTPQAAANPTRNSRVSEIMCLPGIDEGTAPQVKRYVRDSLARATRAASEILGLPGDEEDPELKPEQANELRRSVLIGLGVPEQTAEELKGETNLRKSLLQGHGLDTEGAEAEVATTQEEFEELTGQTFEDAMPEYRKAAYINLFGKTEEEAEKLKKTPIPFEELQKHKFTTEYDLLLNMHNKISIAEHRAALDALILTMLSYLTKGDANGFAQFWKMIKTSKKKFKSQMILELYIFFTNEVARGIPVDTIKRSKFFKWLIKENIDEAPDEDSHLLNLIASPVSRTPIKLNEKKDKKGCTLS